MYFSAINWGKIKKPEDFAKPCELAVRGLDALLDYQDYPVKAAHNSYNESTTSWYWNYKSSILVSKNNTNYQDPDLELIDEYAEAWSYYLIKASAQLAKNKVRV